MENYEKLGSLGEGTYATVVKARHKETGRVVALKRFKIASKEYGFLPVSAVREVKAMRELPVSPYLVELVDVFVHKSQLVLALEFMEGESLEEVIRDRSLHLTEGDVKSFMHMIVSGLAQCHELGMAHRDVKPNNMLIGADGAVKLSDFGLARFIGTPGLNYSPQAFADWYRPPEMLLGARKYSPVVDMWAAGCVLAELLLREPLFYVEGAAPSELAQAAKVFSIVGPPDEATWPGCSDLPSFVRPRGPGPGSLLQHLKNKGAGSYSEDCLDLCGRMLAVNPATRITAADALRHPWFKRGAPRTPAERLPRPRPKAQRQLTALHDMFAGRRARELGEAEAEDGAGAGGRRVRRKLEESSDGGINGDAARVQTTGRGAGSGPAAGGEAGDPDESSAPESAAQRQLILQGSVHDQQQASRSGTESPAAAEEGIRRKLDL